MDNLFTDEVKQKIRDKQYHHFGNIIDIVDFDMFDFSYLLRTHQEKDLVWRSDKRRIEMEGLERRGRTPTFAKDILKQLRKTFPQNYASLHGFYGPTIDSQSFNIHRDAMDVLYLQVIGEINWVVLDDGGGTDLTPDQSKCTVVEKWHFKPGDLIWIPRGVIHFVDGITPRVGFSFGVENDPDPATYV